MRKLFFYIFFFSCLQFNSSYTRAQTTQTLSYTTKDGLPSNSVYRTVLDKYGYLWIATENGLAKFDGRSFKIYTTAQGLPDNEITDLFIDSSQRLWVMPFRKTIAYYNPAKDRFENDETEPELAKIEQGNATRGGVLQYGGAAFSNNNRNFFIYKNGKVTVFKSIMKVNADRIDRVIEYQPNNYLLVCADSLRYVFNGVVTRSQYFGEPGFYSEYFQQTLFTIWGNRMNKFAVSTNGDVKLISEKVFPFPIRIFCKAGKDLVVTSFNGTTYPVDTSTLELKDPLLYNVPVRNVLEDKNGSSWISTIDRGLIKIQQKRISSFTASPEMQQVFNALLVTNKIIAGGIYGQALVYDGVYDIKHIAFSKEKNVDGTVRKIVELKNGYYVACQTGSFIFDKKNLQVIRQFTGANNYSTKGAIALNDSVLLLGNHARVFKYNVLTDKYTDSALKRVTALGMSSNKTIYVGSNDGLYRWDKDSLFYFGKQYKTLSYRVSTITGTADGLLWVGLGSDSLVVLKNDQVIKVIPLGDVIPGNVCKALFSRVAGKIWLGTNKGLNKIQYLDSANNFSYKNTFFSAADGLIGQQVNDIAFRNDTLYVATDGGISYLPVNLNLPVTDIATFITRVSISRKDVEIKENYSLSYDENDINIEFSGVDLTGYFPLFEYSIDNADWLRIDKNSIDLRLSPGKYTIRIRAIKRDGYPSSQSVSVFIEIRTPFWKNPIFWTLVGIVLFVASLSYLQARNKQKQKTAVEKVMTEKKLAELEMQALKAQINPHFVFNCLNSIKGFIFDKDFKQADKYLDRFSELLRSTLDSSSSSIISLEEEITYLDNYLQLEKLRFDDKFEYTINVDKEIGTRSFFVPAMLLQPYVENAIRHGIRHLEGTNGKIDINIVIKGNQLICELEDNGVGREKAATLRNEMHMEYQSRGMQLSKRRAELYGIEQEIIDKHDVSGKATGTIIILRIPLTLKP